MKAKTAARQAVIDQARRWREMRDAARVSWQTVAHIADLHEPRFESIFNASAHPTDAEVEAVEYAFQVLLKHRAEPHA